MVYALISKLLESPKAAPASCLACEEFFTLGL